MRTGDALDPVLFEHPVEQAAGAAIGIAGEDVAVALGPGLSDRLVHRRRDAVRAIVELRRQAGQVEMVEPVASFTASTSRAIMPQAITSSRSAMGVVFLARAMEPV